MKEFEENNSIENNNLEQRQKRDNTFNIIVGVSTLIIAILGATFAYFSATASSKDNDVNVKSAYVSISYDGGTEIKASNLIPSSERVAIKMFQKEVESVGSTEDEIAYLDQDEYTNDTERRCIDVKGREVCYVYQFSIESEGEEGGTTEITGGVKVNKNEFPSINANEFTNLSYILYEVEFEKDSEGNELVDRYGNKVVNSYTLISDFNLIDDNPDHDELDPKYAAFEKPIDNRSDDGNYLSTTYPIACLFGFSEEYDTALKDSANRCKKLSITNQVKHTYQMMI